MGAHTKEEAQSWGLALPLPTQTCLALIQERLTPQSMSPHFLL